MFRVLSLVLAVSLLGSCWITPEGSRPELSLTGELASQYNFRGMVNVDRPVIQTEMVGNLPTHAETGFINVRAWTNWNLNNDIGNSWFPSGQAGKPSQIDMSASYSETWRGTDFVGGVISYAQQNPDDFPFAAERAETKEFFFFVSRQTWLDLVPRIEIHYDFDEVDGLYLNGNVGRDFPIGEKWSADAKIALGWSDERQSDWNYGAPVEGFADLRATAGLNWFFDTNTTIFLTLNGSTIVDSELADWFDQIQINHDNFWASIGVSWGY